MFLVMFVITAPTRAGVERTANMKPEYVCCICGKPQTGWGNNPWPVNEDENTRCCDRCNVDVVIPARFDHIMRRSSCGSEQSKQG